nr:cell wall hydrolase [Novosphingobium flavum]
MRHDESATPRWAVLVAASVFALTCAGLQAIAPRPLAPIVMPAPPSVGASGLEANGLGARGLGAPALVAPAAAAGPPRSLPPDKLTPDKLAPIGDLAQPRPFFFSGSASARDSAVTCLAAAAWYEAGNDPDSQRSVIQVVLNRLKHPSFPKTVCGVVLQGSERASGCQFTFTCDGSLGRRRPSAQAWAMARLRAVAALDGAVDADVLQATHYHADYVAPWWSQQLERLGRVGRHIFYRWPGAGGKLGERMPKAPADEAVPAALIQSLAARSLTDAAKAPLPQSPVAGGKVRPAAPYIAPQPLEHPATLSAGGTSLVIAVDRALPSGRWAMEALARCSGQSACQVYAYADADEARRNAALSDKQRARPDFMLIRERSSGMTLALWDCDKTSRADSAQCLPDDTSQLRPTA